MIRFITSNSGKFREVVSIFAGTGIELTQLDTEYPEIQTESIVDVVRFALEQLTEDNILIDDSGLFIDALNGFPGVFSSYVFETVGCDGILKLLQNVDDREARFECCFGLRSQGRDYLFVGIAKGEISREVQGTNGFGYDPIFIPAGERRTFAQMSTEEKNKISHRGRAARKVVNFLKGGKATMTLINTGKSPPWSRPGRSQS